jgi:hypothetical protein
MTLTSLEEGRTLNTTDAISAGHFGLQNISTEEFDAGLRELDAVGLATNSKSLGLASSQLMG